MSTKDFPDVHAAYIKYVEQLSIEPNPTQLIKFGKQENIPGLTWSKCSKYFKIRKAAEPPKNSIKNKKYHHKTTSGPIVTKLIKDNIDNTSNNHKISTTKINNINTTTINTTLSSKHRRTQSAVDAETHKQNVVKKDNKLTPFKTIMIDKLFSNSELKENGDEEKQIDGETQPNNIKKNQLRLSKTPSTSFKSINIAQKLKPLSSTKETISTSTIHKTVQKTKKKHPLLDKIWNKHKSSIWPKNRMPMSYDLKKWLIDNKFDKFSGKLYGNGIESMDDLRLLRTEDIIEDLCGKNNIGMTIIYRRKFINKVLQFNNTRKNSFFGSLYDVIEDKKEENEKNKKQFKYEMEAVDALTERIKQTTNSIKMTKKLQYDIGINTKNIKDNINKDFDELIKQLALRKKEILHTIDKKNKIVIDRLNEQHKNICQSAKTLIIAQQGTHKQMSENDASEQRTNEVIDLIESTFEECDKYTPTQYNYVLKASFKYNAGNAQIKNYGKLIFNDEQLV